MILQWIKMGITALVLGGSLFPGGDAGLCKAAQPDADAGTETAILEYYDLATSRGPVAVKETWDDSDLISAKQRSYAIYNGDLVTFGSTEARADLMDVRVAELELPAADGTILWYDAARSVWESCDVMDTTVEAGCVVLSTGGGDALIYTPKVYKSLGSGTLRREPEIGGKVRVRMKDGKCRIEICCEQIPQGCSAEYILVQSAGALADWTSPDVRDAWTSCTMDNDRLWCYDGCYHPSPINYIPTGENCYYRVPASYFTRLVADNAPMLRAAEDMTVAMLDVICKQQNEDGFFPTLPASEWLSTDYNLGASFYDTRFNSDLVEIFIGAAEWLDCQKFNDVMNRYFDYYTDFSANCHTATENGILVWDYSVSGGGNMTHTALNHQIAELLALFHWADRSGREDLYPLAEQMLSGVEDTAEKWVREDRSLHYAVYPDGTYGGQDYPYLTYNDLYDLRDYLLGKGRDVTRIQYLMDAKLIWMQANGVTGHK